MIAYKIVDTLKSRKDIETVQNEGRAFGNYKSDIGKTTLSFNEKLEKMQDSYKSLTECEVKVCDGGGKGKSIRKETRIGYDNAVERIDRITSILERKSTDINYEEVEGEGEGEGGDIETKSSLKLIDDMLIVEFRGDSVKTLSKVKTDLERGKSSKSSSLVFSLENFCFEIIDCQIRPRVLYRTKERNKTEKDVIVDVWYEMKMKDETYVELFVFDFERNPVRSEIVENQKISMIDEYLDRYLLSFKLDGRVKGGIFVILRVISMELSELSRDIMMVIINVDEGEKSGKSYYNGDEAPGIETFEKDIRQIERVRGNITHKSDLRNFRNVRLIPKFSLEVEGEAEEEIKSLRDRDGLYPNFRGKIVGKDVT